MRERTIENDPTAYRIRYSRAAQLLHLKTLEGSAGKTKRDEERAKLGPEVDRAIAAVLAEIPPGQGNTADGTASKLALTLIAAAESELLRLKRTWVGRVPFRPTEKLPWRDLTLDRRLANFLDRVLEPSAVVLYFSCLLQEGPGPEPVIKALSRNPGRLKREKRGRDGRRRSAPSQDWLERYLAQLAAPWEPKPTGVSRLLAALGFSRWRRPTQTSYRVHYNLACMFSRLGAGPGLGPDDSERYQRRAIEQLETCLRSVSNAQRRTLAAWALQDPGLRALQERKDAPLLSEILEPDEPA